MNYNTHLHKSIYTDCTCTNGKGSKYLRFTLHWTYKDSILFYEFMRDWGSKLINCSLTHSIMCMYYRTVIIYVITAVSIVPEIPKSIKIRNTFQFKVSTYLIYYRPV